MKEKESRVFLMSGDKRAGLGFFVDDYHLLTCAHVVAACFPSAKGQEDFCGSSVSCEFLTEATQRGFDAEVIVYRKALPPNTGTASEQRHSDIAVLRIVKMPTELPFEPLPVVLSAPQLSSVVVLIGATTDEYGKVLVSHGSITAEVEDGRYYASVFSENRARPGYSGGPVSEKNTRHVVGMVQKAPQGGGDARFVSCLVMRSAVIGRLALRVRAPGLTAARGGGDLALAGMDIQERAALLETLPPGPGVDPGAISLAVKRAFARATDFRKAREVISEANASVIATLPERPRNPHAYTIALHDLPGSESVPMAQFWAEAFDQACMLGPRMVGAVLIAAPAAVHNGANAELAELFETLRRVQ